MKRVIFTLLLSSVVLTAFSQATYYWVGGPTGAWNTGNSWNTALNGSGTNRSSANIADVLIFDGSNIGGSSSATGAVTPDISGSYTIGQLKLQNAASVTLQRSTSSTSTMTIAGDGTNADDLSVSGNSSLTVKTAAGSLTLALGVLGTPATGTVAGTLTVTDGGSGTARVVATNPNSLFFSAGAICNSNTTTSSNYIFGGSSTSPAATAGGVVFQAGSTLVYQGGNSVWGNTATFNPITFQAGSLLAMDATNPASGMFGSRTYANVIIRNNTTINLADNFYNIDTLTVTAGSTFNMRTTGTNPFSGDIINNGTFGATSGHTTCHLMMVGMVPQSIRGTGTFNPISAFSVGTDANVTINTNLTIGNGSSSSNPPTSSITGKLNVQTYNINSTGNSNPGNFGLRAAASASNVIGTLTAGSNTVTLNSAIYGTSNVAVGALVSGTGIPANSYIIATSSNNFQFTISKPATATTATDAAILSIVTNTPSFTTANANGVDGSITTAGTRTFGAGSHYVFNGATTAPFSTSTNNVTGDVTFNAAATTNKVQSIGGTLTLNTGKLTIRSTDTLKLTSGNAIAGGSFGSSKYIVTEESGANVGVITMSGFSTARTFPVGSASNYLPVTLTPTTADAFAVSVFEGITTDATPNGTAMPAAQKDKVVDAVWTINRTSSNSDNCAVSVNWPASLEGSSFAGYGNSIGVARYNSAWDVVGGSGDNTANTAANSFNAFSAFGVGQLGFILPVRLTNLSAKEELGKIRIQWNVEAEVNVEGYTVEKSVDGIGYAAIGSLNAIGSKQYNSMDNTPASNNYYRIKVLNKNGSFEYSNVVRIKLGNKNAEIAVFPNPIKGNKLSLQLNNLEKGKAEIKLFNNLGQQLFATAVNYEGGSQLQSIVLPANISKGMYRLVVTNSNTNLQQTIFVE